jgi:hypothetical protein
MREAQIMGLLALLRCGVSSIEIAEAEVAAESKEATCCTDRKQVSTNSMPFTGHKSGLKKGEIE